MNISFWDYKSWTTELYYPSVEDSLLSGLLYQTSLTSTMLLSHIASFFLVTLTFGIVSSASPVVDSAIVSKRQDTTDIATVFNNLKASTDSILPQIGMNSSSRIVVTLVVTHPMISSAFQMLSLPAALPLRITSLLSSTSLPRPSTQPESLSPNSTVDLESPDLPSRTSLN